MEDFGRNNETRCSEETRYLYGKIILGTWQSRYSKDLAIAELAIARTVVPYSFCQSEWMPLSMDAVRVAEETTMGRVSQTNPSEI